MSKRLVFARFGVSIKNEVGRREFAEILGAFCQSYKSVEYVPQVYEELIVYVMTDYCLPDIKAALEISSKNNEVQMGHVYLRGTNHNGEWSGDQLVIQPLARDRVLRVFDVSKTPLWYDLEVMADFTKRPSSRAAEGTRQILSERKIFTIDSKFTYK